MAKRHCFVSQCYIHRVQKKSLRSSTGPKGRIWRKAGEGVSIGCLARSKKEGTGVKLIVAISYNKGVICCHPHKKMTGRFFASFFEENFPHMFELAGKGSQNLFLQDNCPCQNSLLAKGAMRKTNSNLLHIPVRSPDLNNIIAWRTCFLLFSKNYRHAIDYQITKESYNQFQERVINTFQAVSIVTINRLIASMPKCICKVIARKGGPIRYYTVFQVKETKQQQKLAKRLISTTIYINMFVFKVIFSEFRSSFHQCKQSFLQK